MSNSLQSMDCSPLGSSVHGILQARILVWVVIPFSRGSSHPRDRTQVCHTASRFFTTWATWEAPHNICVCVYIYTYMKYFYIRPYIFVSMSSINYQWFFFINLYLFIIYIYLSIYASLWTKLVEVMEFQLSYFTSWKMMLWKCCNQYASKFGKLSSGYGTAEKDQFSSQSQRKATPKNAQTTAQLHSSRTLAK